MRIHFTDGPAEASGFRFFERMTGNSTDRLLGSQGLLDFFELHLGFASPGKPIQHRLIALRNQMKKLILPGHPFYWSFSKNEFALCADMLNLFDQLTLLGWQGDWNPATPRLVLLASCGDALKANPGAAQRWIALFDHLKNNRFPSGIVSEILVYDRKEIMHPFLARFLDLPGIPDVRYIHPPEIPEMGKNLDMIHHMFRYRDFRPVVFRPMEDDDSVIVIRSSNAAAAADMLQVLDLQGNTLLVNGGQGITLDATASRFLKPLWGLHDGSVNNTVNMLPFQLLNLLKAAPDALLLLHFLNNPACPVQREARYALRRVLMEKPGFDIEFWIGEIRDQLKKLEESGWGEEKDIAAFEVVLREEFVRWFGQAGKASRSENRYVFPKASVALLFDQALRETDVKNSGAATELLSATLRFLDLYDGETIDETQLAMLLSGFIRPVSSPLSAAQAGCIPVAGSPSSVISGFDTVIWWNFAEGPGIPGSSPFYLAEKELLATTTLWSNEFHNSLTEKWYEQSARPLVNCKERLILVVLETANGEVMPCHPFFDFLEAAGENTEKITVYPGKDPARAAELLKNRFRGFEVLPAKRKNLPASLDSWQFADGLPDLRDRESFSSLEKLICYPFEYLMEKMAFLLQNGPPDPDNTLQNCGNAAHRVFELLFNRDDAMVLKGESFNLIVRGLCEQVIREQYVALNSPESELLKTIFVRKIVRAANRLMQHLDAGDFVRAEAEIVLGKDNPMAFGDTFLTGKVDLLLTARDGRRAIVDLKWSGLSKRISMLKDEKDMQLPLYSYLVSGGPDIPSAFFIIEKSRMVSYREDLFPLAANVPGEKDGTTVRSAMAAKIKQAYRIRAGEFASGFVEVGIGKAYTELAERSSVWEAAPKGVGFPSLFTWESDMKNRKPANPYSVYNVFTPMK